MRRATQDARAMSTFMATVKASFALQIEGRLLPEAARELTRLEEDTLLQVYLTFKGTHCSTQVQMQI